MKTRVSVSGKFVYQLAKGENSYQSPATLFSLGTDDPLSLDKFQLISGEKPGYTNLCGLDRLTQILSRTSQAFFLKYKKVPFITIAAKHGNPCGLAVDWKDPETSIKKALFGNPLAIWGGEVIVNFKIDEFLAPYLLSSTEREKTFQSAYWMLDIIAAPKISKKALSLLGARGKRKVFVNPSLFKPVLEPAEWIFRHTRGSFIQQRPPNYVPDIEKTNFVANRKSLNPAILDSLIIAWTSAFNSMHGGNEVAFAKNRSLISCGGGPSTIEAAQIALFKAKNQKHSVNGSVFAADAFFPFTDVPKLLAKAGVVAGLVPSGGLAFPKVKAYFRKRNIPMFYLEEQYRGFCYH